MKRFLWFAMAVFCAIPIFSQNFDHYQPVQSSGDIPGSFRTLSSEKYEAALEKMPKKGKRFERKAKEQFYLESNFLIDELLLSGKVLFKDSITNYVKAVAQKALKGEPGLYDNLNIYVVNSSAVNAFATNNGSIFINMGLLAKLETEAQLAFIICHEAIHYKNKHVIKSYVQREKVDKDPGLFKNRPSLDERLMAKSNYSIHNELEADNQGMEIFLKSGYNPNATVEAFKLLQTSYLPMPRLRDFNIKFFASKYLSYDSTMVLDSFYFEPYEKEDDEREVEENDYQTHPKIGERISQGKEMIAKAIDTTGADFLGNEELFYTVRDMARFELCRLFLINRDYERSLYCAYQLMDEYPDSYYLRTVIMRSIYGAGRLHASGEYQDLVRKVRYNPFEIQPFSNVIYELDPVSGSIVATERIIPLLREHPEDHANQLIFDQLIKTQISGMKSEVDVMTTDSVRQQVDSVVKHLKLDYPEYADRYKVVKEEWDKENLDQEKDQGHVRKLIVFDPVVYKLDFRNDNPISYLDSEESLIKFNDYVKECAKAAGIRIQLVKTLELRESETDEFNDVRFLKRFREDKFKDDAGIISVDHNRCYGISKKYRSDNLAFIGSIELTEKKTGVGAALIFSIIYFPFLPLGIYYAVTPDRGYMNFVLVFNLEEDNVRTSTYHLRKSNDSEANVKSSLYYNFLKVK